jgi:hypothetical protein
VGALRALIQTRSFEGQDLQGRRGPGSLESNVMRNRPGARNAAKRTKFEIRVGSRVVMCMGRHARHGRGTQLQRKRYAVRRHEAGRDIGTKQKQGQQQDAGPRASLPKFRNLSHSSGRGRHLRQWPELPERRNAESNK